MSSDEQRQGAGRADPWKVLGVPRDSTDRQINKAFLARTKEHPPDRDPEQFERVKDAYETLRDPMRRAGIMLEAIEPKCSLGATLEKIEDTGGFVGVEPWLALTRRQ